MSEELLQALSAVGTLGMDTFNACFSSLSKCDPEDYDTFDLKDVRYRTLRIMSALGHCEPDFDKRTIFVCPPVLVGLPQAGIPRAVMTGARTRSMIEKLHRFEKEHREDVSIEIIRQNLKTKFSIKNESPTFPLPNAILIEASSHDIFHQLGAILKIEYIPYSPVPYFLEFSANIKILEESLEFFHSAIPDWTSWIFNPIHLRFEKRKNSNEGSFLASYVRPIDQQRLHIYWINEKGAEIDRDWGRWFAVSKINNNVILYDKKQQALAVPATMPLPGLLSRAAVLCSGKSPNSSITGESKIADIPPGHPMDVFISVPLGIAEEISQKLEQRLQFNRIELQTQGE